MHAEGHGVESRLSRFLYHTTARTLMTGSGNRHLSAAKGTRAYYKNPLDWDPNAPSAAAIQLFAGEIAGKTVVGTYPITRSVDTRTLGDSDPALSLFIGGPSWRPPIGSAKKSCPGQSPSDNPGTPRTSPRRMEPTTPRPGPQVP